MRFGKTIIALLFASVACLAQDPYHNSLAWRANQWLANSVSIPSPTNQVPAQYWWLFSDVATNTTAASWTDRIFGVTMTNGNASKRPTNSALGMHFDGALSQRLTNDVSFGGATAFSILMIVNPGADNSFCSIWQQSAVSSPAFVFDGAFKMSWWANSGLRDGAKCYSGHDTDIIFTFSGANGNATMITYTNNIPCKTNTSQPQFAGGKFFSFGGDSDNGFYSGYLRELILWTNAVLTPLQVSNVHYYATNTYKFSP